MGGTVIMDNGNQKTKVEYVHFPKKKKFYVTFYITVIYIYQNKLNLRVF